MNGTKLVFIGGILLISVVACQNQNAINIKEEKNAHDPSVINAQLCREYYKVQAYQRALRKCNKSLSQNHRNADAHKWLAILHQTLGQDKLAEKHFKAAIRYAPNDSAAHNNYGVFLLRKKRYKHAESAFIKAASDPLYEARIAAYSNAGLCMLKANDKDKAEFYFRQALRINKRFSPSLYNLAKISLDKNKYKAANDYIRRWSSHNKWSPASLWIAIQVAQKLGETSRAYSLGLLLKNQYPQSEEARFYSSQYHKN